MEPSFGIARDLAYSYSEPFREMSGSRKRRLKSSKASRAVWPKPLAPRCSLGPIYASQTLPTTPNLGRNCAAGLRGCVSKKSSTSSLMIGGNSSIWTENTPRKRMSAHFGFQNTQNSAVHAQKPGEDAYDSKSSRKMESPVRINVARSALGV